MRMAAGESQKRKTRAGILRFVNAWLSRTQEKGGKGYGAVSSNTPEYTGGAGSVSEYRNTANTSEHQQHCIDAMNALPGNWMDMTARYAKIRALSMS